MTRGVYSRERVWDELGLHPGCEAKELAASLGMATRATRSALERLERTGCATHVIRGFRAYWTATRVAPKDDRGKSAGAAYGRSFGGKPEHIRKAVEARLAKNRAGMLKSKAPGVLPNNRSVLAGKIALELCWAYPVTTSKTQDVGNVQNMHKRRRGALPVEHPEDKEAA